MQARVYLLGGGQACLLASSSAADLCMMCNHQCVHPAFYREYRESLEGCLQTGDAILDLPASGGLPLSLSLLYSVCVEEEI